MEAEALEEKGEARGRARSLRMEIPYSKYQKKYLILNAKFRYLGKGILKKNTLF